MKISASDLEPASAWPHSTTATGTVAVGPGSSFRMKAERPLGSSPTKPPPLVLPLDARWYCVVWLLVLALHGVCATYLISTGVLYRYMDHPYLTYFADLLAPAPDRHFDAMAAAMIVVGSGHVLCLLEMLVVSVTNQQLTMTRTSTAPAHEARIKKKSYVAAGAARVSRRLSSIQQIQQVRSSQSMARLGTALDLGTTVMTESIWKPVFSRHGLLGVESVHFDAVFATRELIEIGFQTLQAYRISQMITRAWINALFVALVVANCWTTPFWQHFLRRSHAKCRLVCITTDIVLNIITNMVIPWIIFRSYFYEYDSEDFTFSVALIYDDIWFTNLVSENRLLFALSTVDFLSKLVPHVTILGCLVSCKSLLVRGSPRHAIRAAPMSDSPNPKSPALPSPPLPASALRKSEWKLKTVHVVFLLWGAALLGVHVHANHGSASAASQLVGCKQFIRPWFVDGMACATYEHNCHRTPPSQLPLSAALEKIHATTLLNLVMSHCRELVIPSAIQRFPKLLNLEFYNVTLREWPSEAALSPVFHPSLVALLLIRVNMTTFPDGIQGPLPDTLTDVEFVHTNLTKLPNDLHERWHPMAVLYVEFSGLREFPATLLQLRVNDLSLIGNKIQSVEQLSEIPYGYFYLSLAHNPIRALPATIDNGATFGFLGLEETLVTELPVWLSDASGVVEYVVFLHGSPFCLAQLDADAELPGVVVCDEPHPSAPGRYPLAIMAPRRVP